MVEEAEGSKEGEGAEDGRSVTFSNRDVATSVRIAHTLTSCQKHRITGRKKRPKSNNLGQITARGNDLSKASPSRMTTGRLKDYGMVLLQYSMETIETGSRCFPATLMMTNIMVVHMY